MANVQDHSATGSATEEHGAEHAGFLHKLKDKLHIGHKPEEKVAASEGTPASTPASATTTDAPVVSKSTSDDRVSATSVAKPVDDVVAVVPEEHAHHDVRPKTDMSSLAGHDSEHHGGMPTFLAALPDQDIPAEDAPAHSGLHHVAPPVDSEQGEHHHGVPDGGMPTFLAALPEQDVPAEDAPAHPGLHHVSPHVDSELGEHHQGVPEGGVPTFLAALPDQDIPAEDVPAHNELHHVQQGEHQHGGAPQFDSEQVFEQAQQGEHHHGVPTFLVALPDQEIPDEVTKGVESTHDGPAANDSLTEGSLLQ